MKKELWEGLGIAVVAVLFGVTQIDFSRGDAAVMCIIAGVIFTIGLCVVLSATVEAQVEADNQEAAYILEDKLRGNK